MKRNNQRGSQKRVNVAEVAKNNRTLTGVVKNMLSGAGHSLAEVFGQSILPPRNHYNRSKYKPHQGEGERARRRKQIAAGTLNQANGLVFN